METIDWVNLTARWLHILAAIVAAGGTIFVRFVLLPSEGIVPQAQREALHAAMRSRWSKIVAACIAILLITGLYNFWFIQTATTATREFRWYHPVFGIKFLAAMAIFAIASLLSGRTAAAQRLRQNAKFWLSVNVALVVLVVILSGVMRTATKTPKNAEGQRASDVERPSR